MSNPITAETFTFATAAMASGVPIKTLRNWLDRDQVLLDASPDRQKGKWRRFSHWDVLRLALAKPLVDYSVPVEFASLVVGGLLTPLNLHLGYKNSPTRVLAISLQFTTLLAWRDARGWDIEILTIPGSSPTKELPESFIQIDVARIARRVQDALDEATRLGIDDE